MTSFQADWGADFGAPLFKALGAHPPLKARAAMAAPPPPARPPPASPPTPHPP